MYMICTYVYVFEVRYLKVIGRIHNGFQMLPHHQLVPPLIHKWRVLEVKRQFWREIFRHSQV